MRPELANMKGGEKQFWLRTHRGEVDNYYFEHGAEATMKEFNMIQSTLERFLSRRGLDNRANKLSKNDRWVYTAAMESIREVKREVREIKDWIENVNPVIEVGQALINATMGQIQAKVDSTTLPEGNLSLDDFTGKLKK